MKFLRFLIILLPGVFFLNNTVAQPALKRANKNYELSDFAKAVQDYKEVLSRVPDHLEANSKIADSYRHLNQHDRALPHYQSAIAQRGVENIYIFQYGLTLMEMGQYEIAGRVFEKLANDAPDFKTRALNFAESCRFALSNQDPPLFKVTNEYLNTASADFGPALLGDRVVYSSGRTDIANRGSRNAPVDTRGDNRLFITQRDKNGFLELPVTLHSGLTHATNEGPVAYSADGKWVAFTRNNFVNGTRMIPSSGISLTLFVAQANESGDWNNPVPFPHNGIEFSTGYPSFSSDGRALFFASDRPGSYGGFDLYVSYRTGNTWSTPENLGPTVNSIGNEITPFFDGNALYFASDYHKGFGGFDIFRAEESGGRWATVYHGGPGLNSSSDDYGFVFDASRNIGYFVSNRPGGKGAEDIYRIQRETENVVIKVTDAMTGAAVANATLDFSSCGDRTFQTDRNGIFNFQLIENLDCSIAVGGEGYTGKSVRISTLGLRQNRTLEVKLAKTGTSWQGKVFNGSNGSLLDGVTVIATNQSNNEVTTVTTDGSGGYLVALQPNVNYTLRYSKAGFRDLSINFRPTPGGIMTLQNIDLLPVGVTAPPSQPVVRQPEAVTTTPVPKEAEVPLSMGGFSVQLASVGTSSVDLKPYQEKVGDLGAVYSVEEGGRTKIRVGVFNTREQAADCQAKVRAKGYTGAFTVEERGRQARTLPTTTTATTATTSKQETAQPTPAATPASTPAAAAKLDGVMVRLGVFRDVNRFKNGLMDDLGVVQYVQRGDLNIVLLTGYDSRSSAEIGLRKARARGFADAFLVEMKGGELKKVD